MYPCGPHKNLTLWIELTDAALAQESQSIHPQNLKQICALSPPRNGGAYRGPRTLPWAQDTESSASPRMSKDDDKDLSSEKTGIDVAQNS